MRKRLSVLTVGCKASFADSAGIVRAAASAGFEVVPGGQPADVLFINSCTVTHRADRDNRALARRARRNHPEAVLVMSGCFPATADETVRARLPEIDHWLSDPDTGLGPLLKRLADDARAGSPISDYAANRILGHKRTFLKIQDGCDCRCAYCVVPLARGNHRSVPAAEIVSRAVRSEGDGATEFLLTGIHIGRYGSELNEKEGLANLVRRLLDETERVRLRLGSIEPLELTPSLLSLFRETDRLCPHLHIPLQSGSDPVLARMRRPYGAEGFRDAVVRAREAVPGVRIGADVLVGFPGETGDDFEATRSVIESSGIDYLHVFPYSARPGTESAQWPDDISSTMKRERVSSMTELDRRLRIRFLERQPGRLLNVLVQKHHPAEGMLSGISEYGVDAHFAGSPEMLCRMALVRIESVAGGHLLGRAFVPHA